VRRDGSGGSPLRATAVPTLLKRINPAKKRRTNLYDNEDCCNTVYATRYRKKITRLHVTRIDDGLPTFRFSLGQTNLPQTGVPATRTMSNYLYNQFDFPRQEPTVLLCNAKLLRLLIQ